MSTSEKYSHITVNRKTERNETTDETDFNSMDKNKRKIIQSYHVNISSKGNSTYTEVHKKFKIKYKVIEITMIT